jgi:hypothetical protein
LKKIKGGKAPAGDEVKKSIYFLSPGFFNNYPQITLEENTKREKKRADTDILQNVQYLTGAHQCNKWYGLAIYVAHLVGNGGIFLFPSQNTTCYYDCHKGEGGDYWLFI